MKEVVPEAGAEKSHRGLSPRLHSIVSYAGALAAFFGVVLFVGKGSLGFVSERPTLALALALWTLHFARRCAEAAWVHRYSKRLPLGGLLAYAYYWVQGGWIAHSLSTQVDTFANELLLASGLGLFALGECGNTWSHWRLRALRAPGERARRIPHGGLFEWVSSPHYFFEILAWWGFAFAFPCPATFVFAAGTTGMLVSWGLDRHRTYVREFDGQAGRELYPPSRRALVPFLL